ncbi:MAG: helix-turn-helix transcriptional regulator, partial [Treponema sp.]|nr:helix-turn-helix transcriptional regulator [Treponema sp.]
DFAAAKLRMVMLFTMLLDDIYGSWSSVHGNSGGASAEQMQPGLPFDPAEIMELPDLDAWKLWAERSIGSLSVKAGLERRGNNPLPLVKALVFIGENFSKGIQLTDAAEAASVNAAYLSRLFAKHLGSSFVDYLASVRIAEAERLLREKHFSVKETAFAVGFQDPAYFTRIYKKLKGILPTETHKNS